MERVHLEIFQSEMMQLHPIEEGQLGGCGKLQEHTLEVQTLEGFSHFRKPRVQELGVDAAVDEAERLDVIRKGDARDRQDSKVAQCQCGYVFKVDQRLLDILL